MKAAKQCKDEFGMGSIKTPARELSARIQGLQEALHNKGVEGALIVQEADIVYLGGESHWEWIYLPADGLPLFCTSQDGKIQVAEGIAHVVGPLRMEEVPEVLGDFLGGLPKVLGLELDVLPVNLFNQYRTLLGEPECVDVSPDILSLRAIKSAWEMEQMEAAAAITSETFEYMAQVITPGLTEMEFAAMAEGFAEERSGATMMLRIRDYKSEGYPWHVLSGKNGAKVGLLDSPASGEGTSAAFPCGAGPKRLEKQEPVMVDFAFEHNGYHMDETRMFSIGPMPGKALKATQAAMVIHDEILSHARPGVTAGELFELSVAKAKELGYQDEYLGPPGYKVSFVGHGIGLELIERPILAKGKRDVLESGMTFALEPKMVFEGEFGVGVESVFVVTEEGGRLLSQVPLEVFIKE